MPQVKDEPAIASSTFKHKLRDIFAPRAKQGSSNVISSVAGPSASRVPTPSRIPVRKKRGFRDVAQDEVPDLSSQSPVRNRQRIDSTSSIATVVGSRSLSRKGSAESVKTIREGKGGLKRTPSSTSLSLIPCGQATLARAVLTRTTSHNQRPASASSSPPSMEKRSAVPFPSKQTVSLRTSAQGRTSEDGSPRVKQDLFSSPRRSLQDVRPSVGPPSGIPVLAAHFTSEVPKLPELPSLGSGDLLRQVLQREVPDNLSRPSSPFTCSLTDLAPVVPKSPPVSSIPDSEFPEIPDDDTSEEEEKLDAVPVSSTPQSDVRVVRPVKETPRPLGRFEVKLVPYDEHLALWDMKPT